MNSTNPSDHKTSTILDRIRSCKYKFTRCLNWMFVKRMAISPHATNNPQGRKELTGNSIFIFEWQKMPKGYRWF